MTQQKVALLGCYSYDRGLVEKKVEEAFNLFGGIEQFIAREASVFIKTNCILFNSPIYSELLFGHPHC